jgi:DNA-binding response OmpR family regulator
MSHILIIDDDIDLRVIIQEMLQAEGYEVSAAADGAGHRVAAKATSIALDHWHRRGKCSRRIVQ